MFRKIQKLHFVGIGGIGMSGIAELLLNLGYKVSGSDLKPSPVTERLAALGGEIHIGHRAENVEGTTVVVISSAVRPDNVEVVEAKRVDRTIADMIVDVRHEPRHIRICAPLGADLIGVPLCQLSRSPLLADLLECRHLGIG